MGLCFKNSLVVERTAEVLGFINPLALCTPTGTDHLEDYRLCEIISTFVRLSPNRLAVFAHRFRAQLIDLCRHALNADERAVFTGQVVDLLAAHPEFTPQVQLQMMYSVMVRGGGLLRLNHDRMTTVNYLISGAPSRLGSQDFDFPEHTEPRGPSPAVEHIIARLGATAAVHKPNAWRFAVNQNSNLCIAPARELRRTAIVLETVFHVQPDQAGRRAWVWSESLRDAWEAGQAEQLRAYRDLALDALLTSDGFSPRDAVDILQDMVAVDSRWDHMRVGNGQLDPLRVMFEPEPLLG